MLLLETLFVNPFVKIPVFKVFASSEAPVIMSPYIKALFRHAQFFVD